MKKLYQIAVFSLFTSHLFSQNADIYLYKKFEDNKKWGKNLTSDYRELDSLVLYKNGSYYRLYLYAFGTEITRRESIGKWIIKDKFLELADSHDTLKNVTYYRKKWKVKNKSVSYIDYSPRKKTIKLKKVK